VHTSRPLQRTTISLPTDLLASVDRLVRAGLAGSRSQLIAEALEAEVRRREREEIDSQFSAMAADSDYQAEAALLMREFASADLETWTRLPEEEHR
jgi:metal-responsive CopG/Arc/MetJ family transcriptional regulator